MITFLSILASAITFAGLQAFFWHFISKQKEEKARFFAKISGETTKKNTLKNAEPRFAWLNNVLSNFTLAKDLEDVITHAHLKTSVAIISTQMIACFFISIAAGIAFNLNIWLTLLASLFSPIVPILLVYRQKNLRDKLFASQLSESLEMLSMLLRAGRSLPQAVAAVSEELPNPSGEEFKEVVEAYNMGQNLDAALRDLTLRFPKCPGLTGFVVAITILGQTGGNLVGVIDKIREALQMQVTYGQKLLALTSEGRASGQMLGALPPMFFVVSFLLNKDAVLSMFDLTIGRIIIVGILSLWIIGVVWIKRMTAVN